METAAITPSRIASSVIAVPPLARNTVGKICKAENQKIVSYLEQGGRHIAPLWRQCSPLSHSPLRIRRPASDSYRDCRSINLDDSISRPIVWLDDGSSQRLEGLPFPNGNGTS